MMAFNTAKGAVLAKAILLNTLRLLMLDSLQAGASLHVMKHSSKLKVC
jgi:hypothetical protein